MTKIRHWILSCKTWILGYSALCLQSISAKLSPASFPQCTWGPWQRPAVSFPWWSCTQSDTWADLLTASLPAMLHLDGRRRSCSLSHLPSLLLTLLLLHLLLLLLCLPLFLFSLLPPPFLLLHYSLDSVLYLFYSFCFSQRLRAILL